MSDSTVVVLALLLMGWGVTSALLGRVNVTGPLLFTAAGYLIANPDWGPLPLDVETTAIHRVAELSLALVLFSDASRVNLRELRRDAWPPIRLLGIGLPLSIVLGGLLAGLVFGDLSWALAGFVAAALAPTDAALSAQVIDDEQVPVRLRRALNVESGLNDGIATPVVTALLLVAATQLGLEADSETEQVGSAVAELGGGLAVGIVFGVVGAWLIHVASGRGWMATGTRRLATLALAFGAFAQAENLDFNGFIAAFAAGIAYGTVFSRERGDDVLARVTELPELGGQLLALVVWFLFGATLVPVAFDQLGVDVIVYALLSLTVVRMLPVAIAMIRSGLDAPSVLFLGWFGPRGLASVVFALLAIEQLGDGTPEVVEQTVAAVALTVLASVVLHGITAGPGGRLYVRIESAPTTSTSTSTEDGPRSARFLKNRSTTADHAADS